MGPYIALFSLVSISAIAADINRRTVLARLLMHIGFGALAVFSGLRYYTGSDTASYIELFRQSPQLNEALSQGAWQLLEPGFVALLATIKTLTPNPQWFLLAIALFNVFLWSRFARKNSPLPGLFLLLYTGYVFLNLEMNTIRQGVAVAIMLVANHYYIKGDIKKFFLFGLLASLFHASAIIYVGVLIGVRAKSLIFLLLLAAVVVGIFIDDMFALIIDLPLLGKAAAWHVASEVYIERLQPLNALTMMVILGGLLAFVRVKSQLFIDQPRLVWAGVFFVLAYIWPVTARLLFYFLPLLFIGLSQALARMQPSHMTVYLLMCGISAMRFFNVLVGESKNPLNVFGDSTFLPYQADLPW